MEVLPTVITSTARHISVYTNSLGDIVIRQAASGCGDKVDDDVVIVRTADLSALMRALATEAQACRSIV